MFLGNVYKVELYYYIYNITNILQDHVKLKKHVSHKLCYQYCASIIRGDNLKT